MHYLFNSLELIHSELLQGVVEQSIAPDIFDRLAAENEKVTSELKDMVFKSISKDQFSDFTMLHYKSLIRMVDELSMHIDIERTRNNLLEDVSTDFDCLMTLNAASELIKKLLRFIEEYFNKYIPKQELIPGLYRLGFVQEITEQKTFIKESLNPEIDAQLRGFFLLPFVNFIQGGSKCTWHYLYYCRRVFKSYKKKLELGRLNVTDDLVWLMFDLNYNNNRFFNYLTNHIQLAAQDDYLGYLYECQKHVAQALLQDREKYKIEMASVAICLKNWLKLEIKHFERNRQFQLALNADRQEKQSAPTKIFTTRSVSELAYYFKTLEELEIITIQNHTRFFDQISKTYNTPNTDNISADSFKRKYYNPTDSVKRSIKDQLKQLIDHINKGLPSFWLCCLLSALCELLEAIPCDT